MGNNNLIRNKNVRLSNTIFLVYGAANNSNKYMDCVKDKQNHGRPGRGHSVRWTHVSDHL